MRWAAAAIAIVFLVIYLPDAGHGFISDDFRWIVEGRVERPGDVLRVFTSNVGFYRPIVALSFGVDYAWWGNTARGYGITNVALCLVSAWALYALARQMHLPVAAALVATAVWLFNFHAVNMAVLWLSGRTALLVTLFSLAAAHAFFRGRTIVAAMMCFLATLSKEEAVALPALFTLVHFAGRFPTSNIPTPNRTHPVAAPSPALRVGSWELGVDAFAQGNRGRAAVRLLPLWAALGVYLAMRWYSGAFWAGDAPAFYQFSFSPVVLLRNAAEYVDRAGTVAAAVAIALVVTTRVRWTHLMTEERRVLRFAALWIAATFALTVALPVRSSLYALLPSVGTALAVGAVASAALRIAPARFARTTIALLAAVALLLPVYRSRNERWVRVAEVSDRTMQMIAMDAAAQPPGHIVLVDAPEERFNLTSAFGNLFPEALLLRLGPGWTGEIVASAADVRPTADFVYWLQNGRLIAVNRP